MAKLTKAERKAHNEAEEILKKDTLTETEKEFVLQNWHPAAEFDVGASGAFFTPFELAQEFRIDAGTGRIIDLCAGIGSLGYWLNYFPWGASEPTELVCVEINPAYVEIGKKIIPEATWICGDVFDVLEMGLGHFGHAIANPPFGCVNRHGRSSPNYTGSDFAYHVIDLASELAEFGAFILPTGSAPFQYSNVHCFRRNEHANYRKFQEQTGIYLDAGVGINTSQFADQWKGAKPQVEIVTCGFAEARENRLSPQLSLFEAA